MFLEFAMVALLSVCQGDYKIESSYAQFKEDKTYLVVANDCVPTEKKKYVPPPPPPPPKEKEVCEEVTKEDINKAMTIYFNLNSAKIKPEDKKQLKIFASKKDFDSVEVHGYTCDLGSKTYNMKLSERRAENIAKFLEKLKVDVTKIEGHGEYDCSPEFRKKRNLCRKAEIMSKITRTETECYKVPLDGTTEKEENVLKPNLPAIKKTGNDVKSNTINRAKPYEDEKLDRELEELLKKNPNLKKLIEQNKNKELNKKLPVQGR